MTQRPTHSEVFMQAVAQYMSDPDSGEKDNQPVVPGLDELVEVLSMMAAAPLGARPKLNQELIERIRNSPLHPVLKELKPVYKKLGPLEGSPEHLQAQAQAQAAQQTEVRPTNPQPGSATGPGARSTDSRPPPPASATAARASRGFPQTPQPASTPGFAPSPGHSSSRTIQAASATVLTPSPNCNIATVQPSSTPGVCPPPAEQLPPIFAALDAGRSTNVEASLKELSSKLDLVAQAITDVTTRAEMTSNFRTLESNLRRADPTPAALDVAEPQGVQAGLRSISSTLESVAQAVAEVTPRGELGGYFQILENNLRLADSETREAVKASTTIAKTQIEAVDKKVSQMSGKLESLAEVTVGVKRLQAGLLGEAKAERARHEAKNKELENQVKELQQVIHDTRAELLPVEVASKIVLRGTFSDEPDKDGSRRAKNTGTANLVQTAKQVRTNTLGLITKCRALLAFINRDPETDINTPDLGTEGEWGRCVEHLEAFNSKLRKAVEEKEETAQKLEFVGFVIDQVRQSDSIQLFAQDLSRRTPQPTAVSNGLAASKATPGGPDHSINKTSAAPSQPGSSPSEPDGWDCQS